MNKLINLNNIIDNINIKFINIFNKDNKFFYDNVQKILKELCDYLEINFIIYFLSNIPHNKSLEMVIQYGLSDLRKNEIYFNIKDLEIIQKGLNLLHIDFLSIIQDLKDCIKGPKMSIVSNCSYIFLCKFFNHYGAIVFGPIKKSLNRNFNNILIHNLCITIGFHISCLKIFNILSKDKVNDNNNLMLFVNNSRKYLDRIGLELFLINKIINKNQSKIDYNKYKIINSIKRARQEIDLLNNYISISMNNPNFMKILSPLLPEMLNFEPVILNVLIDECVLSYESEIDHKDIKMDIDNLSLESMPGIEADREILKMAIDIILENAIKYSGQGNHIYIRGETIKHNRGVNIVFQNRGLELNKFESEKIFQRGYRGEISHKYFPIPLECEVGLSEAKKIIKSHNGNIYVEFQKKGEGPFDYLITFTINLPTVQTNELRNHEI